MSPTARDWDKEMAEIDKVDRAQLGRCPRGRRPRRQRRRARAAAAIAAPAGGSAGRALDLGPGAAGRLAVGMTQWPYAHACGFKLFRLSRRGRPGGHAGRAVGRGLELAAPDGTGAYAVPARRSSGIFSSRVRSFPGSVMPRRRPLDVSLSTCVQKRVPAPRLGVTPDAS